MGGRAPGAPPPRSANALATTSNLFLLEVVQKRQYCQLCVLRENST